MELNFQKLHLVKNCILNKIYRDVMATSQNFFQLAGAPPPGWGEEPRGEGGAEEEEGEHDAADDRHGAEAEHHLRQLLQGSARESLREQVHVNH